MGSRQHGLVRQTPSGQSLPLYRHRIPVSASATVHSIWEDDAGSQCDYAPEKLYERLEKQANTAISSGERLRFARSESGSGSWVSALVGFGAVALIAHALSDLGDDEIGFAVLPPTASGFEQPVTLIRYNEGGGRVEAGSMKFIVR